MFFFENSNTPILTLCFLAFNKTTAVTSKTGCPDEVYAVYKSSAKGKKNEHSTASIPSRRLGKLIVGNNACSRNLSGEIV
jgi:hypothetical protein